MENNEGEELGRGPSGHGAHEKHSKRLWPLIIVCALALALTAGIILLAGPGGKPGGSAAPGEAAETSAPTPMPTVEPSPEPTPFVITEAWFDDALFVGDSLTISLYNYTLENGGLGSAVISYANGYACHLSTSRSNLLPYKGSAYTLEGLAAETGAGKVFIMLAMNDIGLPIDELRADWEAMLGRIAEASPEARIFVQSGTPIYDETAYFTNANMLEYNEMLKALCDEKGYTYVDIARGLADETGHLKQEYHLDFVHFDTAGAEIWVENLYNPACYSIAPTE